MAAMGSAIVAVASARTTYINPGHGCVQRGGAQTMACSVSSVPAFRSSTRSSSAIIAASTKLGSRISLSSPARRFVCSVPATPAVSTRSQLTQVVGKPTILVADKLGDATKVGCLGVKGPTANAMKLLSMALVCSTPSRNVAQASASLKTWRWLRSKYVGVSLVDKTIAIMGFSIVGSEIARQAKGLGMAVIAHDPYASADGAIAAGVELVSFDEVLSRADFISICPTTSKIFSEESFSKCKKGVRIVNVARRGLFHEESLVQALTLHVFTVVQHEDVVVTPHLGASTQEAQEGVAVEITERALQGELAATAVNAPIVPAEVLAESAPCGTLAERLGKR